MPHGLPHTGLIGSERALTGGLRGALGVLDPFVAPGRAAVGRQAALAGAQGPEAQREAFAGFVESPGQAFIREQGERTLRQNAAALGGIGGPDVRKALLQFGQQSAAQDFANQFARLGQLSGLGARLAVPGAQLIGQTGRDIAGERTRAGEQIAGQVAGTTSALANLAQQQGQSLAGQLGAVGGGLAEISTGAGTGQANLLLRVAELLSSLGTAEGNQIAQLLGQVPQAQSTEGSIGGIGQFAEGIGTVLPFLGL